MWGEDLKTKVLKTLNGSVAFKMPKAMPFFFFKNIVVDCEQIDPIVKRVVISTWAR